MQLTWKIGRTYRRWISAQFKSAAWSQNGWGWTAWIQPSRNFAAHWKFQRRQADRPGRIWSRLQSDIAQGGGLGSEEVDTDTTRKPVRIRAWGKKLRAVAACNKVNCYLKQSQRRNADIQNFIPFQFRVGRRGIDRLSTESKGVSHSSLLRWENLTRASNADNWSWNWLIDYLKHAVEEIYVFLHWSHKLFLALCVDNLVGFLK